MTRAKRVLFLINRTWWGPADRLVSLWQLTVSWNGTESSLLDDVMFRDLAGMPLFGTHPRNGHPRSGQNGPKDTISRMSMLDSESFSSRVEMRRPHPTRFLNGIPFLRSLFKSNFEPAKNDH